MITSETSCVRFLRIRDVVALTGLSRSTIYRRAQEGAFPAPLKDYGVSLWPEPAIKDWQDRLMKRADEPTIDQLLG